MPISGRRCATEYDNRPNRPRAARKAAVSAKAPMSIEVNRGCWSESRTTASSAAIFATGRVGSTDARACLMEGATEAGVSFVFTTKLAKSFGSCAIGQ